MIAERTGDYHLTGYHETGITICVGYTVSKARDLRRRIPDQDPTGGDMYGSLSREMADLRAKDLRDACGSRRPPRGTRGWRRRLGARLIVTGTRLASVRAGAGSGVLAAVALPAFGWIVVLMLVLAVLGVAAWAWGADSREPGGRDPFGRDRSREG
jgi:hypothetical protein